MPGPSDTAPAPASRLARRLGFGDAVVVGLGAMLGAGVFAALGPAATAAGGGLLVGLAVAAVVATCNATSSARLAAVHPESGGTYVYGRLRLGPAWGFVAGWGFVVGKTSSCAAMALTVGAHALPDDPRPVAVLTVVALVAVNLRGVQKTARVTRVILVVVLAALAVVVAGGWSAAADRSTAGGVGPVLDAGWGAILESAGLLFFAFAGYARLATLGEEVVDPARTIPRAVAVALATTLAVYAAVATTSLLAVGPAGLAGAAAPLVAVVEAGGLSGLAPLVRAGGAVAAVGVLLSLLVGVSRTAFAMGSRGDLPRWLDAVDERHRVPHRAELAVGVVVVALVAVADVRGAIGFSSFAVLAYYAVANAAAWTLPTGRRLGRAVAALGLVGCVVLAATLPVGSVVAGAAVLAVGAAVHLVRSRLRVDPQPV